MKQEQNRYEIFLKVVETGNITKAAESMHYTQSGVSHAIAALEDEAGVPLFIRSKTGVTLTVNGERLLSPIQQLVNQQRNLAQSIDNLNNIISGTIRIGTFTSVSAQWLPTILRTFHDSYPSVQFELFSGNHDEIASWIKRGKIDCGFLTAPAPETLCFTPLKGDQMMAIFRVGHPLANHESVSVRSLLSEPFIMPSKGSDSDIQHVLSTLKKSVITQYLINDAISVMALVEHGFGVSILPELVLRNYNFNLTIRPLNPPQERIIGIASPPLKNVSVVTKTFLQFLTDKKKIDLCSL